MQSVASEAVEFGVREAGRFLSSRDRPYRDSACSASLACWLVRQVEVMTFLKAQPLHAPPSQDTAIWCLETGQSRQHRRADLGLSGYAGPLARQDEFPEAIRRHSASPSGIAPPFRRALR